MSHEGNGGAAQAARNDTTVGRRGDDRQWTPATRALGADATELRVLARSIVRELRQHGYHLHHIVGLATELIELTCESLRSSPTTAYELSAMDKGFK